MSSIGVMLIVISCLALCFILFMFGLFVRLLLKELRPFDGAKHKVRHLAQGRRSA